MVFFIIAFTVVWKYLPSAFALPTLCMFINSSVTTLSIEYKTI